ncbi:MAG: beta-propeller fold lactonase family protein [Solobacterium sp.]|nr:beta-propeller fold lactonase family protein [Solobacterium sp.]
MDKPNYAVIGSWDWDGSDTRKGITVCKVNEKTGNLSGFSNYLPDVKCGSTVACGKDGIIYFVDERKELKGRKTGGGGYVLAAKIDEKGRLEVVSEEQSMAVTPSYCCLDESGRYLIAVHHTSTRDSATKLKKNSKGEVVQEIIYDDAAVVLFTINSDGTIGKAVDFHCHAPKDGKASLLHSVYRLPGSDLLIVCDKGLDQVYCYAVRRGKLVLKDILEVPDGSDPRYAAFHPEKPLFYVNNEQTSKLYTVTIQKKTGGMKLLAETELMDQPLIGMASDVVISPDGKYVYTVLRFADLISVCSLDEKGIPSLVQTVPCGGSNARGMAFSKDGRFLYVCNTESDVITVFKVQADGKLKKGREIHVSRPANLCFL